MESTDCIPNRQLLIRELASGHELTRRLENNLDHHSCPDEVKTLVQDILNSWERCRSMAIMPKAEMQVIINPRSFCSSLGSELNSPNMFKKRRTLPRLTSRVDAGHQTGSETPPNDGHSWRKYGQKDILGSKFPRAYFRCTHRHTRGCMATKYVQRSDENPSFFSVRYQRNHTCIHSSPRQMLLAAAPQQELPSQEHTNAAILYGNSDNQHDVNFSNSLTVKTDNLVSQDLVTGSFFPSSPISCEQLENYIFSRSSAPESYHMNENFSSFISPQARVASPSNFRLPTLPTSNVEGAVYPELAEVVISATKTTVPTESPSFDMGNDIYQRLLLSLNTASQQKFTAH